MRRAAAISSKMFSVSPLATLSVPSATSTPAATKSAQRKVPHCKLALLRGQVTTFAPDCATVRMSSSVTLTR